MLPFFMPRPSKASNYRSEISLVFCSWPKSILKMNKLEIEINMKKCRSRVSVWFREQKPAKFYSKDQNFAIFRAGLLSRSIPISVQFQFFDTIGLTNLSNARYCTPCICGQEIVISHKVHAMFTKILDFI